MGKIQEKSSNIHSSQGLEPAWLARWPEALRLWGMFLRLPEPVFCRDRGQEAEQGLAGSFAAIRLSDHRIILSPRTIEDLGLRGLPLEILGHEIGHHVLCPADLADMGRMLARMRRMLPTSESAAPMVGNLYTDLLINDRLFRQQGLRMDYVYQAMENDGSDPLWRFYLRIYEILWGLEKGSLAKGGISSEMEGDAQLGNRVVRNFARDWVRGSGRFAALCLPYLLESMKQGKQVYGRLMDAAKPGPGEELPGGLAGIDPDEIDDSVHPAEEGDGRGPDRHRRQLGGELPRALRVRRAFKGHGHQPERGRDGLALLPGAGRPASRPVPHPGGEMPHRAHARGPGRLGRGPAAGRH